MSWLLFIDESGHDHQNTPYEVRGGVAIHSSRLWAFIQQWQRLEESCFGSSLSLFHTEVKGAKLLEKKRFRWAEQGNRMEDEERRKKCRRFLTKGLEKKQPLRDEFTAYGQASLEMAAGIMELLHQNGASLFASAIPKGIHKTLDGQPDEYLRKDHVFLFERFFYFLEEKKENGLIVMDEVDKALDRRFVSRLQRYFTKTAMGRYRSSWIVPAPFFVSSEMTEAVQAADLCIYMINWGFRLPARGMNAAYRPEIAEKFGSWLGRLQYQGQGYRNGEVFDTFGIVYVPDPCKARE